MNWREGGRWPTQAVFWLEWRLSGYDEVGNRISQTDANNHTTTYSYDQNGRRVGRKLPAGQTESYVYDAAGNLKSKTDFNGKTTQYAYDTSNRLLSKTPDASFNAPPVGFTYTANGLRLTMSDVSGSTTYGYDTRNRLTSKQTPFGTLSYTYDNAGDVATIASSNTNGASLTYTYDVLNRLSTVTDNRLVALGSTSGVTNYSYDPVGNLSGYTYPNGVAGGQLLRLVSITPRIPRFVGCEETGGAPVLGTFREGAYSARLAGRGSLSPMGRVRRRCVYFHSTSMLS